MSSEPHSGSLSPSDPIGGGEQGVIIESVVRKTWGTGHVCDITVTNLNAEPNADGYLEFQLDKDVKNIWGCDWDGGRTFRIAAEDLPPGGTAVIGMTVYGTEEDAPTIDLVTANEADQSTTDLGPVAGTALTSDALEAADLTVTGAIDNEWSSGFVYRAVVANAGVAGAVGTYIDVLFDGEIEKFWGATLIETIAGGFRFEIDSVPAGGSQDFGFVGRNGPGSSVAVSIAPQSATADDPAPVPSQPEDDATPEPTPSDPTPSDPTPNDPGTPSTGATDDPEPSGLTFTGAVRYDWGNGYVYDLVITNTSNADHGAVTVDVTGVTGINNIWNVDWDGGSSFTVPAGQLAAGASVTVGLSLSGNPAEAPEFAILQTDAQPVPDGNDPPTTPDSTEATLTTYVPDPEDTQIVEVPMGTSAAALQSMIDAAEGSTTFVLQAGAYTFDRQIHLTKSDIAVIGAGSDQTVINVDPALGESAFRIGDGTTDGAFRLTTSVSEGATSLTLQGDHSFQAGDYVYLSAENTDDWLDSIGDSQWRKDAELRRSMVRIEEVDGQVLTLESGVHFDFDKAITTVESISVVTGVRVGGMMIDYGLGTANPSDFSNRLSLYDRVSVIELDGTRDTVLHDLELKDVPSHGITVSNSVGLLAADLTIYGAHNKGTGGNGYAVQLRESFEGTIVNLEDQDMRHSLLMASWRSAVDNTVHVRATDRDINFHGGRDKDNTVLVDQSIRDDNSDIISPTLFVNVDGRSYGAPTDPDANSTVFGHVVGTRLDDMVRGSDAGSFLDGAGGDDTLLGGQKSDVLKGGEGDDVLSGGGGEDIALYDGAIAHFTIVSRNGNLIIEDDRGAEGADLLSDVEWLLFADAAMRTEDMSIHEKVAVDDIFLGPKFIDPSSLLSPTEMERLGYEPRFEPLSPTGVDTTNGWSESDIVNFSYLSEFDLF